MNHNTSMKTTSHGKKKNKKRTSSAIASSSSTSTSTDHNTKDRQDDNNTNHNVVTIQVIQSNDNHEHEQNPIVCSFPGGIPSSCTNSTSSEEQEQQLSFQWFKKSKSTMNRNVMNGQEYVIKGQDTACQYYGNCIINNNNNNNTSTTSNTKSSSLSISHTKLCVAIYDKHTNQVIVTPTIGNGTIITLQQFVPSYYNNKKEIDDDNTTTTATRTTNALLFADFGSAKKRRVLQSQEANRVTVDAVVAIGTNNSSKNSNKNKNNNANDMIFHNSKMSESNRIAIQQQQQMNMAIEATTTTGSNNIDDNDDDDEEQQRTTNNNTSTNSTNSSMNLAIEIATNSWRQTFLPNYNINAKNAKDIYTISLIVGYDIWNHTLQNIIKKYNILNDNGISIIQYFNRNNVNNNINKNESHPYHSNHKDIIYCTELVQKLIETKIKYNNTQNHNQQQQLELYKCILLLNYFICLYKQFQSNKFKLPMIASLSDETNDDNNNNDNDDNIDNDNNEMNDDNVDNNTNTNNVKRNTVSLRTKLYGTTPISILQRFLDLFTTSTNFDHTNTNSNTSNTKHIMSRAQQDKCLVHIFIIYIMTYAISNNSNNKNKNTDKGIVISDIVPLFYELQLNDKINHGILLLRQAGCIVTRTSTLSSFSSSKDTNSSKPQKKIKVELNVPLTFPKTKKKQR